MAKGATARTPGETEPPPGVPRASFDDELAQLAARLERSNKGATLSVFVSAPTRGWEAGYGEREERYLASGMKMLVLIEAYRQLRDEQVSFDKRVRYGWADVRDGAPFMNRQKVGSTHTLGALVRVMIRDSDNAATDLAIDALGGTERIQQGLAGLGVPSPKDLVPLMDVRREVYGRMHPATRKMKAWQVRDVRWRDGFNPRLDLLAKHAKIKKRFTRRDLDEAYRWYYATGRNHLSMRDIGLTLERMASDTLLGPTFDAELRRELREVWTSGHRLDGALPKGTPIMHKTGTQHRRICDLALVEMPDGAPLVLTVAVGGLRKHTVAEALLRQVGRFAYDRAVVEPAVAPGGGR